MSDAKIYTIEELRKMNAADQSNLLKETVSALAHMNLAVRMGKEKQSHKLKLMSLQIARLNTISNSQKNEK